MKIKDVLAKVDAIIHKELISELTAQGHKNTGELERSIKGQIDGERLQGVALAYIQYLNYGFDKSKASYSQVPFLINYFKSKGLNDKEAKQAAFATVSAWKREGMPTQGSYQYSKNGFRKDVIENLIKATEQQIKTELTNGVHKMYQEKLFSKGKKIKY